MTTKRAAAALAALAIVVGLWWVVRLADGRSCDDGNGIRLQTRCVDVDARFIDTSSDGVDDLRLLEPFDHLRSLEIDLRDLDGDLTGLEALTSLETLTIRGDGEAVDLSALGALGQLQYLDLYRFDGGDLSELTLPALYSMQLTEMTLDAFPNMPAVSEIELWSPVGAMIPEAATVPQLRRLDLRRIGPVDGDALAGLVTLESLTVDAETDGELGIEDLTFAAGMPNLEALHLNGRGSITDLSPLSELPLRSLSLEHLPITDLGPLGQVTTLQDLLLDDAPVTSLGPLAPLTNLTSLNLIDTDVGHLEGVEELIALERLTVHNSTITDLGPLAELPSLVELRLDRAKVSDLGPLSGLTGLARLSLWGNPVTDLSPIEGLPLISIDLNSTSVDSVEPLAGISTLESLRIGSTEVTDLSPLEDLPNLTRLVPPDGDGATSREEVLAILAALEDKPEG